MQKDTLDALLALFAWEIHRLPMVTLTKGQ